ncbi:MAG TPA: argininosuccinate lyase [Burkholderiales bacterium]|nr:argininosuccinate lyase [Burkholderiales bacterium]
MQEPSKPKSWSGRFEEPVSELTRSYTSSIAFDRRLAAFDVQGSLAHARMLNSIGILTDNELSAIEDGMRQILEEIVAGAFPWSDELEDVHMNIEQRLTALVGEPGRKLHTGRSRNDQVATDLRLFLREAIDRVAAHSKSLQIALVDLAEQHAGTIMPGFTHLQVAQPVTFGHHLMAYYEMLKRDRARLFDCRKRVNRLPLGAAALAGTSYTIDREMMAEELGFDGVCENSLDAVSDRDFAIEFCACAALTMMHLSRLAEELILWMSPGFAFIEIADRFTTGSSIMPQKKNPDVAELARGKTGRVYGDLIALLTVMKAQPLAYNRDNQEDKESLFDAADTVSSSLRIFAEMLPGIKVNTEAMRVMASQGFATATDLADYLVRKGLPFREAHEAVAKAVRFALDKRRDLSELSVHELKKFSKLVADDVSLTLEGAVKSRSHFGGTAPQQVRAAISRAREELR